MLKIWDQGSSNGCTIYSIVTINNLQNISEFWDNYEQIDPKKIYEKMIKEKPDLKNGVPFKEAIDRMKKKRYITGIWHIERKEQTIKAIDIKCYPLVYLRGVNWKKTGEQKKICREPDEYWQMKREEYSHAFAIVWPYTAEWVKCVGSWWSGRGDNWYFQASREDISKCKSIVAVIDKKKWETRENEKNRLLSIIKELAYAK